MTGPDKAQGKAMVQGVTLLTRQVNHSGGINGFKLHVMPVDDGNDPDKALKIAERLEANSEVIAVVGHWNSAAAAKAIPYYGENKLLAMVLASGPQGMLPDNPWVFRPLSDETVEVRFLANYVRNVVGEKTVFILHEATARGEHLATTFDEVYQRFGTKILYKWPITPDDATMDGELKAIVTEIDSKKLFGTYLVLGNEQSAARMISALRKGGVKQRIVGLRHLATQGFQESFVADWKGSGSAASALNGVFVTTPMLFDMAGEKAQKFRTAYIRNFDTSPDWVAAYAYESAKLISTALTKALPPEVERVPLTKIRQSVRDTVAASNSVDNAFVGVNGPLFFNEKGMSSRITMAGMYDGIDLVAALTQLSPIREEGVTNLLGEVTSGRALYVNDRFMYKTNVVYTGVRLEKVSALEISANTCDLDFAIWFRWKGDFEPQNVVFTNAVVPIPLDHPIREGKDGDMSYRAYRVKGKFYLGYSDVERKYGTKLAGLSFHHHDLGSNNLMYVNDILGMNMLDHPSKTQKVVKPVPVLAMGEDSGQFSVDGLLRKLRASLKFSPATDDPFVEALIRDKVLSPESGWLIERGWISQEVIARGVDGNPLFVGFGKPQPLFSMLDVGMILKPDRFDSRDVISDTDSYVYLAIFSFVMSVLALVLDGRDRGQFWRIQTLLLRLTFWPLLLVASGNLARDYGLAHFANSTVDMIVLVFDILWWFVPARLVTISMERFIWVPLETRTHRKVPNVIRMTLSMLVYVFTFIGVVAFVMDKSITSMLATSGVLVMIMGMAVQANLRDIVSGIVLNIERPFNIGDSVKINNIAGIVTDINWRTTRITAHDGQLISFPNGKASEAEIQNFTRSRCIRVNMEIYTDFQHNPNKVLGIVNECLPQVKLFVREIPDDDPLVFFVGVECVDGHWVSHYTVGYSVHRLKKKAAAQELWQLLWPRFVDQGIDWQNYGGDVSFAAIKPEMKPA